MTEYSQMARQRGYTLIEMAIVMSVLGVIIASFLGAYGLYYKNQIQMTSLSNANRVVNALGHFLIQNGRYPCPARMDVARDHPQYGMETDCTDTTLAVGNCANGLCIEQGERQVNINPNPGPAVNITPRVRRGAVPFRILGLPENAAEDGHNTRLYYAVTENLTRTNTYRKDGGGISVLNENDITLLSPNSSAHFVVFSVGADRRGGVTRYGQEYRPCDNPANAADALNCNTSTTAPHNFARYRMASHSTAAAAAHYDDYVRYYASVETPLWRATGATSTDIVDLVDVGAGGRIGVGVSSPVADVHVVGDVRTNDKILARQICNATGGDCFMSDAIGGNDTNLSTAALQCNNPAHPSYDASRPYVIGYAFGQAICGTGTEDLRCPQGQILRGVEANGTLICESVTGCAPISVNMCEIGGVWEQAFIPSGVTGQVHQTDVFGASFRRTYRCANGNWVQESTEGVCNCVPLENQVNHWGSCAQHFGGPSDGWTGQVTYTFSRSCPDGRETWGPVDTSTCQCVSQAGAPTERTCQQWPFNYPASYSCSGGLRPLMVSDWICTGPQSGYSTPWVSAPGSDCCACAGDSRSTTWIPCGFGYSGDREVETTITCAGTTTTTPTGNDTCVCNPSLIDTGTQACPDGQIGVILTRRDWNCAATPPAWGNWYTTSDNCGPVTYQWKPKVTGEGPYGVALPNTAGTACATPGREAACSYPATGGYTHYSACRCE
jgi:prepilin-type N-terminal cleavage/methylation domain-containing protein